MTYVLDASAILRFTDKEPGFERVRALLHSATTGELKLWMSAVNWGEIVTVLYRRHGLVAAKAIAGNLSSLPLTIVSIDALAAERAGIFRQDFSVPYADAFAGSLAMAEQAVLVTADFDFKPAAGTMKIEFLTTRAKTKP